MTAPNDSRKKWIALSMLILFVLGGGVYQLRKRGSGPTGGESSGLGQNSAPNAADSPDAPKPSGSDSGEPLASSGQPGGAAGPGAPTSLGAVAPAPDASTGSAPAPAARSGGFFSSLFSRGKAPVGGAGLPAVAPPSGPVAAVLPGAPGLPGGASPEGSKPALTPSELAASGGSSAPAVPAPPKDTCYTVTYRHKSLSSHSDEETCSHHKNWLKLKHKDVNAKSVCVRVNGTPVHYLSVKGHADELIFGSIAGPKSKVTVRYCTGKMAKCEQELAAQECAVPKDEFMEAIGGSEGKGGDARLGQWDPSNPSEREADVMAKLDGEVKKELETNDELNGRAPEGKMFKDWLADADSITGACGTQQASN